MRLFFWFLLGGGLLARVGRTAAQDLVQDSTTTALLLTQPPATGVTAPGKWRLSAFVGYHQQFQKGYLNDLYLTNGVHAGLATDYFVGRNWGLGIQMGYQNLVVSDQYQQDPSIPKTPSLRLFPLTSLHSFMLTVGPAFSFPLGRRLLLDINLRGGIFYNDAPVLGAYYPDLTQDDVLTGTLVTTIMPTDQRVKWGLTGSVGLTYPFTQRLGIGLAASSSFSALDYAQASNNLFSQRRLDLKMYGVQLAVSYQFSPGGRRTRAAPVVPPTPVCYPPLLDTSQPSLYEVGTINQPVFKWRSSAPVYTEGERYTFRLFTLPGNKIVYEKVVQEPQIVWPAQVPLPDTGSYFFYTIHTSRTDEFEQSCRSEPVVGTFGFFKRQSTNPSVPAVREPANLFTLKLYELRLEQVPQTNPRLAETRKRPFKPVPSITPGRQPPGQQAAPSDSGQTTLKTVPTLIFEGPSQQPTLVWPGRVALPERPTVYQYVINRISNREIVQNHYIMVEPDGCTTIVSGATKNAYLQNNMAPEEQVKPDPGLIKKE